MRLAKTAFAAFTAAALTLSAAFAADPDPKAWDAVTAAAKGQTVYFNAWGGDTQINDYIA